jgi:hypothetical protein
MSRQRPFLSHAELGRIRSVLLGPKRFIDRRAGLTRMSPNMLRQRLKELEEAGPEHRENERRGMGVCKGRRAQYHFAGRERSADSPKQRQAKLSRLGLSPPKVIASACSARLRMEIGRSCRLGHRSRFRCPGCFEIDNWTPERGRRESCVVNRKSTYSNLLPVRSMP